MLLLFIDLNMYIWPFLVSPTLSIAFLLTYVPREYTHISIRLSSFQSSTQKKKKRLHIIISSALLMYCWARCMCSTTKENPLPKSINSIIYLGLGAIYCSIYPWSIGKTQFNPCFLLFTIENAFQILSLAVSIRIWRDWMNEKNM